ncbi:MAG TPA: signal peptidase II [Bryobacteraceae bacterium]|nr:signal peptidase II [Bryobacteraceae bacterium]
MTSLSRVAALVIALVIFVLDRLTKMWIERNVSVYDTYNVIPGLFNIVHTKNKGAAFGLFAEADSSIRTVLLVCVSLAVLVFICVSLLVPSRSGFVSTRPTLIGLSLVMGGALGNIYDRIVYGQVTDFLEFYQGEYRFAAFNVADSAITVGAGLLILDMWRTRERKNVPEAH